MNMKSEGYKLKHENSTFSNTNSIELYLYLESVIVVSIFSIVIVYVYNCDHCIVCMWLDTLQVKRLVTWSLLGVHKILMLVSDHTSSFVGAPASQSHHWY